MMNHEQVLKDAFIDDIQNAIHYSGRNRTTVYIFADDKNKNVIWSDSLSQVERDGFSPYGVAVNGSFAFC